MNDIFYFKNKESIYNYVDENTDSYSNKNLVSMKVVLVNESVVSHPMSGSKTSIFAQNVQISGRKI